MTRITFGPLDETAVGDPAHARCAPWRFNADSATRILCARQPAEVLPLLTSVEEAAASGKWAVVVLSYEAAPVFDHALRTHPPDDFPLAWAALFDQPSPPREQPAADYNVSPWRPLVTRAEYEASVEKIRDLIARGHTYQVNYSFPIAADFDGDSLSWYRKLCLAQNAGYSAYVDMGRYKLLCFSPELFFERAGNHITTRPMKGTARRGRWLEEDEDQANRLYLSEKDRAENVMIVDLLRNDLGKVSVPGTVQVARLFELERYETLWQMTSTVNSVIKQEIGLTELLAALFPCGSITGAPKVRTMEIIRSLEPFPRRIFSGTIGVVRPGGDCCFNVAIRTVLLDSATGRATFGVGGGITFDSTPAGEYDECLTKCAFLTEESSSFQLLESILLEQGKLFLAERHLARLISSAKYFGFQFDAQAISLALDNAAALRPVDCWKLRLLLSKDGTYTVESALLSKGSNPRRVAFAPQPIDSSNRFLFHKTTRRSQYDSAVAARPDCDDVVLWNERGEVTESSIANIVVSLAGRLYTPARTAGLLNGTFREELLERGTIQERKIHKEELKQAGSFFLVNSVRKWMPAVLVE
jgi:para-aminobenzoate synthetase/4-amino-4-deoxychorismate lyase